MSKNGKSIRKADASPISAKNASSESFAAKAEKFGINPDREMAMDAYKKADLAKAVKQDVQAAVSLLSLMLEQPAILDLVIGEVEKIRAKIIEQESMPKREDFHPEMTPNS